MKKIFTIILIIFVLLFMLLHLLFYRRDLSKSELEAKYFKENSFYIDVTIKSLEQTDLKILIHYQDFGNPNDPVVVLLHGMFASSDTFLPWKDQLLLEGFRVILIDLPYHGLSEGFSDQITSIRRSAYVVYEILKTLEIDTIIIGGNSMGGGVSWYFASEFHQSSTMHVNGLILIDSIYQQNRDQDRSNLFSNRHFINWISKMTPRFLLKSILSGVYGSNATLSDEVLDRYYDMIRKEGYRKSILESKLEDLSNDISAFDRIQKIKSDQIETLILWGNEDSWISKDVGISLRNDLGLSSNRLIVYEGLGHVPMEEAPLLTAIDLIHFLNQIYP
jgi:pimeloyl-ACP methyl ester carboxylesterase